MISPLTADLHVALTKLFHDLPSKILQKTWNSPLALSDRKIVGTAIQAKIGKVQFQMYFEEIDLKVKFSIFGWLTDFQHSALIEHFDDCSTTKIVDCMAEMVKTLTKP